MVAYLSAILLVLALLPPAIFVSGAEDSVWLGLHAHNRGRTVWTLSLRGNEKNCQTAHRKISSLDCADLGKLATETRKELLARKKTANSLINEPTKIDEPDYALLLDGKSYPVEFVSPETCELAPTGELRNCKRNSLSSAQKLLLRLRALGSGEP